MNAPTTLAQPDATPAEPVQLQVPGANLHTWVSAVTPFVADDEMLPVLQCVQLLVHPQPDATAVVYLAATNRYALAVARLPIAADIDVGVPAGSPWDLVLPASQLNAAVNGLGRRGRAGREPDVQLLINHDSLVIQPRAGFERHLVTTGRRFPRWDTLLHVHNPTTAEAHDTIAISARHLGLLGRTLRHADRDMARIRTVRTPAGAPMAAVTINTVDATDPWLTVICMGSHTNTPGIPQWADLDQLTAELDHTGSGVAA